MVVRVVYSSCFEVEHGFQTPVPPANTKRILHDYMSAHVFGFFLCFINLLIELRRRENALVERFIAFSQRV